MDRRLTIPLVAIALAASSAVAQTVAADPPGAPANLSAQVVGTSVQLAWTAGSGSVSTYLIEAGSAPGLANLASFPTGSTATAISVTAVPAGTYYVRVRAANVDGASPPSNEVLVVVTGPCAPAAPTGLLAAVSGNSVTLMWSGGSGATSFVVEVGSAPGRADRLTADVGLPPLNTLAATAAPGLYYVRVRARNGCGLSAPSNEAIAAITIGARQTITFDTVGANGTAFTSYTESPFLVAASFADWVVSRTFGNPAPFIQFVRVTTTETLFGDIAVTAGGLPFRFEAVDLYSSVTPIPYEFVGMLGGTIVFTSRATVPNTFGRFATISNPDAATLIDTLIIRLYNPATACCGNPVGLDNLVVSY